MRLVHLIFILTLLVACSETNKEDVQIEIDQLEKELSKADPSDLDNIELLRDSLTNTLLKYYRQNPNDDYAPECLDKVHFIYSAKGDYVNAARYADTIISEYPNYINRLMVIESQYNNYDMFIKPRDKEKVKYYLEMLLTEDKNMSDERRAEFEYRLEFIDLTIEQLMERNMTELK